jgi:hypothetical protein
MSRRVPELADEFFCFNIDNPNGGIITAEGDEVACPMISHTCNGGHGIPVDFVEEKAG